MPYRTTHDLPDTVKSVLPAHAQAIFKSAYNSAYDEYKEPSDRRSQSESREEVAVKVAWSAVKHDYEKGEDGKWHLKKK